MTDAAKQDPKPNEAPVDRHAHQAVEHILQFFTFAHLPPPLQETSKVFRDLAQHIVDTTPRNPERTAALRKLLEAKDAAVRARLAK